MCTFVRAYTHVYPIENPRVLTSFSKWYCNFFLRKRCAGSKGQQISSLGSSVSQAIASAALNVLDIFPGLIKISNTVLLKGVGVALNQISTL